jgi:hypothetical protein
MISQTLTVTGANRPIFVTPQGLDLAFSKVLWALMNSLGNFLGNAVNGVIAAGYMLGEMAADGFNAIFGPSKTQAAYHTGSVPEGFDLGGDNIYQRGDGKLRKYDPETDKMVPYKPEGKSFFDKAGDYFKGKALKTWGKANNNLVAYYKGYSIENGYNWNDEGTNIVGVRNESVSERGVTVKDDYFLVIKDNKPVGLYFGTTEPGESSYPGSADNGGVAHMAPGNYQYAMEYSTKRQTYILRPAQDVMVNRDQNEDGRMSTQEKNEFFDSGRTILFHFGGEESYETKNIKLPNGQAGKELAVVPQSVNRWSQGCQVISGSFYYDLENFEPVVYANEDVNHKGSDPFFGAYENFIDDVGKSKNINYVLMDSADSASKFNKTFSIFRNTSINAYLEQYRPGIQKANPKRPVSIKQYEP